MMTGIPVRPVAKSESKKLVGMQSDLQQAIIGQDEATMTRTIHTLCSFLRLQKFEQFRVRLHPFRNISDSIVVVSPLLKDLAARGLFP